MSSRHVHESVMMMMKGLLLYRLSLKDADSNITCRSFAAKGIPTALHVPSTASASTPSAMDDEEAMLKPQVPSPPPYFPTVMPLKGREDVFGLAEQRRCRSYMNMIPCNF